MIYIIEHPIREKFIVTQVNEKEEIVFTMSFSFAEKSVACRSLSVKISIEALLILLGYDCVTIWTQHCSQEFFSWLHSQSKKEWDHSSVWEFVRSKKCTCGGCGMPLRDHVSYQSCPSK